MVPAQHIRIAMTTYVILIDNDHMPELTCDVRAAKARQQNLVNQGFSDTRIARYKLKTQGANFGEIAFFQDFV